MKIKNPVIRGFYPDPSVCAANGKFYLVTSSMQFFPGVPLFESEDLINWHQIGHVLTRKTQVELHGVNPSGGVFAPTIRYNDGRFYMVTTNDTFHRNFYVWTDDIHGEWSDPVFVDQEGIDPSLFFEDGKAYFMSNGNDKDGKGCILQCEIDIKTGEKLTPSRPLWRGNGGRYLESPHMYKFGDYYYLMAAEGGTEYGHMITYARGASVWGPFTSYRYNPVLTNRDFGGNENPIQGTGHGDLVQDAYGHTFMVCLGFRQIGEWIPYHHLGREVFLVPVTWDGGWFRAGVDGKVLPEMDIPVDDLAEKSKTPGQETDYSMEMPLDRADMLRITYIRDPEPDDYDIKDEVIKIKSSRTTLDDTASPSFAGIRQSQFNIHAEAEVDINVGEAGLTCYMDEHQHYDLARVKDPESGIDEVILRFRIGDAAVIAGRTPVNGNVRLIIDSTSEKYGFFAESNGKKVKLGTAQTRYISTEVAGGFTGVFTGLYATSRVVTGVGTHKDLKDRETASFTEFKLIQQD